MRQHSETTRRNFLAQAGSGLGLAALSSATIASLLREVQAATKSVAHLTPQQVAMDEDYWAVIQNSFSVTRGTVLRHRQRTNRRLESERDWQLSLQQAPHFYDASHSRRVPGHSDHTECLHDAERAGSFF